MKKPIQQSNLWRKKISDPAAGVDPLAECRERFKKLYTPVNEQSWLENPPSYTPGIYQEMIGDFPVSCYVSSSGCKISL